MKKLFYLFIMALFCTLWSCSKSGSHIDEPDAPDNPNNPTDVTLEISTTDLVFEAKGGERGFTIYCDVDWTIANESKWCTTNVTEGNGYGRVTVTVEAYSETEDRNTNLTVKAGDKTKVLTITQKHGDAIILSKDKFDIPQEGGEIAIEVKSNIEYQVSIPSKFQSWIKQTPESRAVTVKNFSFTVSANEAYEKREGYIVFSGNSLKDTVYVYQAQKNQLILTENTYNIRSEGKDITVELKTNVDYEVVIPDSVNNWISLLQTKAVRTDKLNFSIAENDNTDSRKAIIIIKDKNSVLSDTLYINQSQKNALILTQKEYKIKAEGETITVELKSNVNYDISIPRMATNWITLLQTRAIRTDKIHLEIKENTSYDNRNAKIVIKDRNSSLSDTLYINQAQRDALILGKKQYDVAAVGEQISIEVRSNIEYKVTIPQTAQNWIQEIPQSRGLATSTLNYKVLANPIEEVRSAKIIIQDKNSALSDTVQINQAAKGMYVGDIVFKTEQDLIDFHAAGYTKVRGNVIVSGLEITTLQKLGNLLVEINGSLKLECYSLTTLDGLDGLKTITDNLIIEEGAMTSLEGLQNLEMIRGDFEVNASTSSFSLTSLESFEGLENLQTIGGSLKVIVASGTTSQSLTALKSFQGLSSLKSIGKDFEVYTFSASYFSGSSSYSLTALESFEGLENLQTIGGSFKVMAKSYYSFSLNALKSFQGLNGLKSIGGDFEVCAVSSPSSSLTALESFEGLENLQTIGGSFKMSTLFRSLAVLKSFQGLSSLKSIGGDFEVNAFSSSLTALESFGGLENLQTIGGSLKVIAESKSLTALKSFQGLSSLKSIGGDFEVNSSSSPSSSLTALESFEGLENLQTIGGSLKVIAESKSLTALKSFQGLSSLKSIGGDFEVNASSYTAVRSSSSSSLTALESFEGLENLQTIGGSFKVIAESESESESSFSLTALKSFQGLSSLKSIGGDFEVCAVSSYFSSSLTALESFEGLENLQTIGGSLKVMAESENSYSSSLTALKSFQGLSKLKSIGGDFEINASYSLNALEFFVWLENLQTIGGSFKVIAKSKSLTALISFHGLSGLKSIGGDFEVNAFSSSLTALLFVGGLENLQTIGGGKLTINNCQRLNSIDALKNVESIKEISITYCPKLYDFCVLKNIVQNMSGTFYVNRNGYNPTKYQLLNGECSKQPE